MSPPNVNRFRSGKRHLPFGSRSGRVSVKRGARVGFRKHKNDSVEEKKKQAARLFAFSKGIYDARMGFWRAKYNNESCLVHEEIEGFLVTCCRVGFESDKPKDTWMLGFIYTDSRSNMVDFLRFLNTFLKGEPRLTNDLLSDGFSAYVDHVFVVNDWEDLEDCKPPLFQHMSKADGNGQEYHKKKKARHS